MLKVPMVNLGDIGLEVSKLGFGTFDFGVASLRISPSEGARILSEAYKLGVNFWDSSEDYGSHAHIASALKLVPRKEVVISTKTNAQSGREARQSLENSLKEINTDYVDVFLLHNVKDDWVEDGRRALNELNDAKTTGIAKAVGLSTHSVAVVRKAARFKEVDVIMATCCNASQTLIERCPGNIPLEDGSIKEMYDAIKLAHKNGKGIVAMKVLGTNAPPLVRRYRSSIKAVVKLDFVDAMVIGMKNIDQVKKNVNAILST